MQKNLIRQGTVFDTFCCYENGEPKYILKKLISNSSKRKMKLEHERAILKAVSGKQGYSSLIVGGGRRDLYSLC